MFPFSLVSPLSPLSPRPSSSYSPPSSVVASSWVQEQRGTIVGVRFHASDSQVYDAMGPGELFSPRRVPEGSLLQLDDFIRVPTVAAPLECVQEEPQEEEDAQVGPDR